METISCKVCGKLFNYTGGLKVCAACAKKLEDKFSDVKDFIYEHHTATMAEISEEFEVPIQQIQRWVREERLAFSDDSPVTLSCESCGARIKTGRYCPSCKRNLQNGLENAYKKPAPESPKKKNHEKDRMRFLQ